MILTATLKVKTLGKIVALLGVCGRIGKNDTQNKTIWDLLVKKITPSFKHKVLLAKQLWQQGNNSEWWDGMRYWMQLREYNEKWYKEMLKALKYSEINRIVSDLEDLIYTGRIQWYKLQL